MAEALFAARGFTGVGLREVSVAAGLSKSSLFHHFPTKQALCREVLDGASGGLVEALESALQLGLGPSERLEAWADAAVRGLSGAPATARLCLRALLGELPGSASARGGRGEAEVALGRMLAGFEHLIAEGMASGDFRQGSARHLAPTLLGAAFCHFAFTAPESEHSVPGSRRVPRSVREAQGDALRDLLRNALLRP